jgi:hypothetical protein
VLGPQNCGKSALVRAVIKTMQKEYEGHLQPIYIDGRMGGWLVASPCLWILATWDSLMLDSQ